VSLVLAGISRAIAQRVLPLALLVAAAGAAPAAAAGPDALGVASAAPAAPAAALPGQVTQAAQGTVGSVPGAAAVAPAVRHVADTARGAVDATRGAAGGARRAADAVAPAAQPLRQAAETAADPVSDGPDRAGIERVRSDPVGAVSGTAGELAKRTPVQPPTGDPVAGVLPVLDGALRQLGDTLRATLPVDSLAAPVAALLSGAGPADLAAPASLALGRLLPTGAPPALGGGPGQLGLQATAPRPPGFAVLAPALHSSQSASALPPAAEAGGRPGSPSPWMAPAPAAGGAATVASGGLSFVPFLALLVLAALAAPKLLRRLDPATGLLRLSPFVCALERPG
jgi:collagen type IV alpha